MEDVKRIHDRYFADGFLLEAATILSGAKAGSPLGRGIHDADRITIFTAFATEAHVNHAIETGLSGAAREAVSGLSTLKKIELVPELAGSTLRPDPATLPFQDLRALFKRRNKLAHPVPHVWEFRRKENGGMRITVPDYGHDLADSARWLSSLCHFLTDLAASGVDAWRDHDYLARRLLDQDRALRTWTPRNGPALAELVDYLVDATLDEEEV